MAITITGNQVNSTGDMYLRVASSSLVERFGNNLAYGNDYQPAFQAAGTTGWTYMVANTWNELGVTVTFNWTWFQKGSGGYGMNGNGRYYAPRSGYYYFHADMYQYQDTNNTNNYTHFLFGINSNVTWNNGRTPYTIYGHGNQRGIGSAYASGPNISAIMFLNEGQYCSPYMYKGNSGSTRIYGAHSFFCGHLIS